MAEFPAMPLWTDAYLADTAHLTYTEHGLYLHILMTMWRTPGCQIPNDDDWINRKFAGNAVAVQTLCAEFCSLSDDRKYWWQKRLRAQWAWCCEKRGKASQSAKYRWDKEKGSSERIATAEQTLSNGNASKSKSKSTLRKLDDVLKEGQQGRYLAKHPSAEWDAWKAHYTDTKQLFRKQFLDGRELEGRAFEFDSQWPPGYQLSTA